MKIYIYAKHDDAVKDLETIVDTFYKENDIVILTMENKRSFREYKKIKVDLKKEDILVISSLHSLGSNNTDIVNEINWFIERQQLLFIADTPTTYECGISQSINQIVLKTVLQYILKTNQNIVLLSQGKKNRVGRNKKEFPEGWDELYKKWANHDITSKEFIEITGLQRATFYNMITSYKEMIKIQEDYQNKYHSV